MQRLHQAAQPQGASSSPKSQRGPITCSACTISAVKRSLTSSKRLDTRAKCPTWSQTHVFSFHLQYFPVALYCTGPPGHTSSLLLNTQEITFGIGNYLQTLESPLVNIFLGFMYSISLPILTTTGSHNFLLFPIEVKFAEKTSS